MPDETAIHKNKLYPVFLKLEELELLRLGPESIRRRVRGLSGEMLLESQPGKGSGVRVRIPL